MGAQRWVSQGCHSQGKYLENEITSQILGLWEIRGEFLSVAAVRENIWRMKLPAKFLGLWELRGGSLRVATVRENIWRMKLPAKFSGLWELRGESLRVATVRENIWKMKFFQAREKSGKFEDGQRNF